MNNVIEIDAAHKSILGFKILRPAEVENILGISHSTLYRWIDAGHLPKPLELGPNTVGWRYQVIADFLSAKEAA